MDINVEKILDKLENQHEEHKQSVGEIERLINNQVELLKNSLEKFKPIYTWYKENNFMFTHPTIKLRSGTGPIMGFDQEENEVIVFSIEKGRPERIYLHDNDERKFYPLRKVVTDGYFESAMEGLLYLESMLENYLLRNQNAINTNKASLEKY